MTESRPSSADLSHYNLLLDECQSHFRRNNFHSCLPLLNTLLSIKLPPNIHSAALSLHARCHIHLGLISVAIKSAQSALKITPNDPKTILIYADAKYENGDFEDALVGYWKVVNSTMSVSVEGAEGYRGVLKCEAAILQAVEGFDKAKIAKYVRNCKKSMELEFAHEKKKKPTTRHGRKDQVNKRLATDVLNEEFERELLGDIYEDRVYLKRMLEEFKDINNSELKQLVQEGSAYLDSRLQFWFAKQPRQGKRSPKTGDLKKTGKEKSGSPILKQCYLKTKSKDDSNKPEVKSPA